MQLSVQPSTRRAEEGDVRLVDEAKDANWVTGFLEIFLNGSWRRVCEAAFAAADVAVACRQLGYGAGTVARGLPSPGWRSSTAVDSKFGKRYMHDAVIWPSCTGHEAVLMDCREKMWETEGPWRADQWGLMSRGRCAAVGVGLRLACVAEEESGAVYIHHTRLRTTTSHHAHDPSGCDAASTAITNPWALTGLAMRAAGQALGPSSSCIRARTYKSMR